MARRSGTWILCGIAFLCAAAAAEAQSVTLAGTPAQRSYHQGDLSSPCPDITVTCVGGVWFNSDTIGHIRLILPDTLDCVWDNSVTSGISYNGAMKLNMQPSANTQYANNNKTVILKVQTTFSAAASVIISGLKLKTFGLPSSGVIGAAANGSNTTPQLFTAASLIIVSNPTVNSAGNQSINPPGVGNFVNASNIVIQDGNPPGIWLNNGLRITIPVGLNMTWNTGIGTVTAPVTGGGSVSTNLLPYEDGGRTVVLNVTNDFVGNAFVTISGLQFANIGADSGPIPLEVSNGGGNGVIHAFDNQTKTISGQTIVSTASNQVYTVGDPSTATPTITVTASPGSPSKITSGNGIRLILPNINMRWDQTITTAGPLVFGGNAAGHVTVGPTIVTYPTNQTALIALGSDFTSGQVLTIDGLRIMTFNGAASAQSMTMNTIQDSDIDNRTIAIGAPTMTSGSTQIFTVDANPNATIAANDIVVSDDTQNPAVNRITAANNIRIRIPTTPSVPNLAFDQTVTTVTFPAGNAVGFMTPGPNNVTYEDTGHTAVINVATNWTGLNRSVTIRGLVFKDFTVAMTPRKLQLCVNGAAGTTAFQDPFNIAIGGIPKLDSFADQAFTVNDPDTNAQQITVTDAAGVPNITALKKITIQIPSGFPMTWDTGLRSRNNGLSFSGTGVGHISALAAANIITYTDPKTAQVDVLTDFGAGETLIINGLQFQNFGARHDSDALDLFVDIAGAAVADSKTIGIGHPNIALSSNQTFGVNDPSTVLNTVTVTEDPSVPRIKQATAIRIRIPAGLGMIWDNSVQNETPGGLQFTGATGHPTSTPPTVTYEDLDKTAVINLQSGFAGGESLQIDGLKVKNITAPPASLGLDLEVNNQNTICRTTTQTLSIGARPVLQSIRTADTNGNGSIDHLILTFDKNIDPLTTSATSGLGFTISAPTYIIGAGAVGANVVTFTVVERGVPDTGIRPLVSYNAATGNLQEIGTGLETSFTGALQAADGAAAVVTGVSGTDIDGDGHWNTVVVSFSEALATGQEDLGDWRMVDADGTTNLLQGLTTSNLAIAGNTVTFTLANASGTTGTPRFLYNPDANPTSLRDLAAVPNLSILQTNNQAPIIRVGPSISVGPSKVTLDASNSSDPNGQPLKFSWSFPVGITLLNANTATPSFLGTTAGTYAFTVTVSNALSSANANVQVTILNVPPGADAGSTQTVNPTQSPVYLVALASADANGDALTYTWSQLTVPNGGGFQVGALTPIIPGVAAFTAPTPTAAMPPNNILRFQVAVSDGVNTTTAQTIIRVNRAAGVLAPTANAGPDQVVTVGDRVFLDGSLSLDTTGGINPLQYLWTSTTPLSSNTTVNPFFDPALPGLYTFTLVVTNPNVQLSSFPSTVRVLVQAAANQAPVAEAHRLKPTGEIAVGDLVVLDSSGSRDPEGHAIAYAWIQTAGPSVILATPQGAQASFTPVKEATYTFRLIVGDGVNLSISSSVSMTVKPLPSDVTFTAFLTAGTGVAAGHATLPGTFNLNFGTSFLPVDVYFYYLEQTAGPAVGINSSAGFGQFSFPPATFYTISPTVPGYYEFRLAATSRSLIKAFSTIGVVVDNLPLAYSVPVSVASGPLTLVPAGQPVTLESISSIGATQFYWSQVEGPPVALTVPTAASPTFTPVAGGQYTFALTVTDGTSQSAPSFAVVTVAPATATVASSGGGGGNGGCGFLGLEGLLLLPLIWLASALRRRLRPQ